MKQLKPTTIACASILALLLLAPVPAGAVDMSRYVALGDSLTMGVISSSIGEVGQLASYPRQIHLARSSAPFEQPLVSDPGMPARLTLKSLSPLVISPEPGAGVPINTTAASYQNLAVSGAEVSDTLRNRGSDARHTLVLRGRGTAVEQAVAQDPTFITLWIGNNDLLEAALSGIVVDGITLTPLDEFEADFRAITDALAATGADMALANLPGVTALPFVSTIKPFLVDPETQEPIRFEGRTVPLLGPDGFLSPEDKVLISAGVLLARGDGVPAELGGTGVPLPDTVVLNVEELEMLEERAAAYNRIIKAVADETGSALVNIHRTFDRMQRRGFNVAGVRYTTDLLGGLFSFDGVHGTPFSYAVVANEFIRAINRHFGDSQPLVSYVPFITGGAGGIGTTLPIDTSTPIFTGKARRNIRRTLGHRTPRTLARLKRRWLAEQETEETDQQGG